MEYMVQPISIEEYNKKLPYYVISILHTESAISFVAKEGDKVIGVAVFNNCVSRADFLALRYVYVMEEYRNKGVATQLLEYAEGRIREKGIKGIYAKNIWMPKEAGRGCEFMLKERFIPLSVEGHYLSYFIQDLRECIFASKIEEMNSILSKVRFWREVPKYSLREFAKKLEQNGQKVDFDNIDLLFSSFYMEGDEIKGFLHLDEIEENVLLLSDTYIENNNGMILAAMLANALKISIATLPDEAMVCLQIYKENEYRGVRTVFGEAEHDELVMEYVKLL